MARNDSTDTPPAAPKDAEPKVRMVCRQCGSEDVTRDAWAAWDPGGQEWVLGAVFEHAFCHHCLAEAKLESLPC